MGNKNLNKNITSLFKPNQWIQFSQNYNNIQGKYGSYQTYINISSSQKIDKYEISYTSFEEYKQYLGNYFWRMKQPNIVNTLYIRQHHSQDVCSTIYKADVFIQHIPVRLDRIQDIEYPQNLYILQSALEGYSKLYYYLPKDEYFKVSEDQVCIDEQGLVRVWFNCDLSKNEPLLNNTIIQKENRSESSMVNQIIKMIQKNTHNQFTPISIEEYFLLNKYSTFEDAKRILKNYQKQYKIIIPSDAKLILNKYQTNNLHKKQYQQKNKNVKNNYYSSNQIPHINNFKSDQRVYNSISNNFTQFNNRFSQKYIIQKNNYYCVNNNYNNKIRFHSILIPNIPYTRRNLTISKDNSGLYFSPKPKLNYNFNYFQKKNNSNQYPINFIQKQQRHIANNHKTKKIISQNIIKVPQNQTGRLYNKISPVYNIRFFFSGRPTVQSFQQSARHSQIQSPINRQLKIKLKNSLNDTHNSVAQSNQLQNLKPNQNLIIQKQINNTKKMVDKKSQNDATIKQQLWNKTIDKQQINKMTRYQSIELGNPQLIKQYSEIISETKNSGVYYTKHSQFQIDPQIAEDLKYIDINEVLKEDDII